MAILELHGLVIFHISILGIYTAKGSGIAKCDSLCYSDVVHAVQTAKIWFHVTIIDPSTLTPEDDKIIVLE